MHTIIPSILQECFNSGREIALNFHAEQYLDIGNLQLNSPELHRHTELQPTFVIYTILHVPKYFLVMPEALTRIDVRLLSGSSVLPSTGLSTCLQIQLCSWFTKFLDTAEPVLRTPGRKNMEQAILRDSLESLFQMPKIQFPCSLRQ